jgi:hypothetical protein
MGFFIFRDFSVKVNSFMLLKISGDFGQVGFSHKNLSGNLNPVNCDTKFGFLGCHSSQPGIASCYSTAAYLY